MITAGEAKPKPMTATKTKLPPKEKSTVVEVNLKHVTLTLFGILSGATLMGITIIVVKDYTKLKRQEALINGLLNVVETLNRKENSDPNGNS